MTDLSEKLVEIFKSLLEVKDLKLPEEIYCAIVQINSTFIAFDIFYLNTIEDLICEIAYGELSQNFANLTCKENLEFFIHKQIYPRYLERAFKELPRLTQDYLKLEQLIDKYYSPIELSKLLMTNRLEFNQKFEILEEAVKYNITLPDSLILELKKIVAENYADTLVEGGFQSIYEFLLDNDITAIIKWASKELIQQVIDDTQDYWAGDCEFTDRWILQKVNDLIDKTFSTIELTKLVVEVENAKSQVSEETIS